MKEETPFDRSSLALSLISVFSGYWSKITTSDLISVLTIISLLTAILYNSVKFFHWFKQTYIKKTDSQKLKDKEIDLKADDEREE
jgi:hypothetical protein